MGALITGTTTNKIATTTWLGNHLLPSKITNGLTNDQIMSISVKYVMSSGSSSWTSTVYYKFNCVKDGYSVFTGDTPVSLLSLPNQSPHMQMMRNLTKALFLPTYATIKTATDILTYGHIIIYESVESSTLTVGSIVSWNNLTGFTLTKTITSISTTSRYNSGGLMFGNNYPGGTSPTGKLIDGLTDYNYHAIKGTEYYEMFGLSQANDKCIKETDTSIIQTHTIFPVIGRLYSTYTNHNSNTPLTSIERTATHKIIPPYTLGYWYYDVVKILEMTHYNPYSACVFETATDKAAFGSTSIYYGYGDYSDKCTFNNVFLHNADTINFNTMYDDLTTDDLTWRYAYYEGCQYNPTIDSQVKTLDISEIDRLYIYNPQASNGTINPYIAPSIFKTTDTNFNSTSEIKAFNLRVDDIREASNYYHPTLTGSKLYQGTYGGPLLTCTSVIKSVPVIHVPSAIVCSGSNPIYSLYFNTTTKVLTVTFNSTSCQLYDAAYASSTSNCTKITSSSVSDTSSLIDDLNNAKYEVKISFTDGYGNTETYTDTITGLYTFTNSGNTTLTLTGTKSIQSKTYNLKNLVSQTYYCNISVRLYMKDTGTEHLLYGSPTASYRTSANYASYSMGSSSIQGDTPPDPSGAAVAMEIGTYDE